MLAFMLHYPCVSIFCYNFNQFCYGSNPLLILSRFMAQHKRPKFSLGPSESRHDREDAPVLPDLPVPNCHHGIPAEVKQSRWPNTAGRAYYRCSVRFEMIDAGGGYFYDNSPCDFLQWIDGPDKFDPRIRLFPYYENETKPYNEFKRWVPPPPNPPPLTFEEQQAASCIRVKNPPVCHCGVPCKLQHPNLELTHKFIPFFRCKLRTNVCFI